MANKIYGNYAKHTVGYDILNGGIEAREEGLRILSKESDRQKMLRELAKISKTTKDSAEKRSIEATLKRFNYKEEAKQKSKPEVKKKAKVEPVKSSMTYTVTVGRKGKTFATKHEAKAYEAEQRKKTGKAASIVVGTKKPTHKVVNFISKLNDN